MNSAQTIHTFLSHLYKSCRLPIHYIENNIWKFGFGLFAEQTTNGLLNPFLCDTNLLHDLLSNPLDTCYIRKEPENSTIIYGIYQTESSQAIIVGPVSIFPLTNPSLRTYMKCHKITNKIDFSIRTASMEQVHSVLSLLSLQFSSIFRIPVLTESVPLDKSEHTVSSHQLLQYQLGNYEESSQHFPWSVEKKVLSCVANGDIQSLNQMLLSSPFSGYAVGKIASSSLKQTEYSAVLSVSILARAAIHGGLNPYVAYAMNDLYLQKIEKYTSETQYFQIFIEAITDFTQAVRTAKKTNNQSIHIQKAKDYITRHINQRFSLVDIANHVGLSHTYLSALFKKTEQMTIKEYILCERIDTAKSMLTFSDYSITYIAEYLCFHSQSHFGQVFKQLCHETPSAYRTRTKSQGL